MIHVCAKCGALVDTSTGPAGRTVCPPCWTDGWRVDAFGNVYRVDVVVGGSVTVARRIVGGIAGHCIDIDGGWWHAPGECTDPWCRIRYVGADGQFDLHEVGPCCAVVDDGQPAASTEGK